MIHIDGNELKIFNILSKFKKKSLNIIQSYELAYQDIEFERIYIKRKDHKESSEYKLNVEKFLKIYQNYNQLQKFILEFMYNYSNAIIYINFNQKKQMKNKMCKARKNILKIEQIYVENQKNLMIGNLYFEYLKHIFEDKKLIK